MRFYGIVVASALAACEAVDPSVEPTSSDLTAFDRPQSLADGESVLLLVGTNDVHGSIGRLPQFGGYLDAARAHLQKAYGAERSTLLVLDAGDAMQGTLVSNHSEGQLVVRAMSALGYTAAIAGNHGFDFGPSGWTTDKCPAGSPASCDPLDALRRSVSAATFPFLGANVMRRSDGKTLDFLPPSTIVEHQGRGIAIIGLENRFTDRTTVPENVAALRFGAGVDELREEVERLDRTGEADVFVLVMHEGDSDTTSMKRFLESLPRRANGAPLVDAAIAGHSHRINDAVANDIPYIQSGANGEMFGVVELLMKKDGAGRLSIDRARTRTQAAIPIVDPPTSFLQEPVIERAEVRAIVKAADDEIRALASEELATTPTPISRSGGRLADSEIGNVIADAMRRATQTDIAMINGGDVRDDIAAGAVTFEELFRVLPKNLELAVVDEMPMERVLENMRLAIRSCGRRGAMQISGITVVFRRNCDAAVDGEDRDAVLLALLTDDGQALYRRDGDRDVFARPSVRVATTDFVLGGGAGYGHFIGITPSRPVLALRDEVAGDMKHQRALDRATFVRGRYLDCAASPRDLRCPR